MDEQPMAEAMDLRRRKAKLRPEVYDAFINSGPDVKDTLAFAIYDSLHAKGITILDNMELQFPDNMDNYTSAIQDAIYSSRVQIAIFSPRFGESPWCLDELVHMLETKAPFIPIFCDVKPSDLRDPDKGVYAAAFHRHEHKEKICKDILDRWKAAIQSCLGINGYEFSTSDDNVERLCRMIALDVQQKVKKHQKDVQVVPASTSIQVSEEHYSEGGAIIERFSYLASTFNWGAIVLVLGSYGLVMSNPLFWMCWSILVVKAVAFWEWIEGFTQSSHKLEATTRSHIGGSNILKIGMGIALITLLCTHDITQRQNTTLLIIAASIILFEGITPLLRGREGQKLKALIFFIPSTLNAMISMTGPIILGGDLGPLMCKEAFWGFTFLFLVDVLAEVIPRFVNGRRFPFVMSEDLPVPKTHHVVLMLRLIVEGSLCWWMGKLIYQDSYFPSHLGIDDCNKVCRERSKHLLITMVALGGLQATGTFIAYTLCCILAHRHDHKLVL